MKVYVLEVDVYDCRHVRGVYSTLEAAKAAHQPEQPEGDPGTDGWVPPVPPIYRWYEDGTTWEFEANRDAHCGRIRAFELEPGNEREA